MVVGIARCRPSVRLSEHLHHPHWGGHKRQRSLRAGGYADTAFKAEQVNAAATVSVQIGTFDDSLNAPAARTDPAGPSPRRSQLRLVEICTAAGPSSVAPWVLSGGRAPSEDNLHDRAQQPCIRAVDWRAVIECGRRRPTRGLVSALTTWCWASGVRQRRASEPVLGGACARMPTSGWVVRFVVAHS